jgi:hypothetical protein
MPQRQVDHQEWYQRIARAQGGYVENWSSTIEAARANQAVAGQSNVRFAVASARDLPSTPASYDLIYSRRGPTSILQRSFDRPIRGDGPLARVRRRTRGSDRV